MERLLRHVVLLLEHWPYLVLLGIVWLGMAGAIGRGFGFHRFFRDDKQLLVRAGVIESRRTVVEGPRLSRLGLLMASPAFWSQFALVCLAAVAWIGSHSDPRLLGCPEPGASCPLHIWSTAPEDWLTLRTDFAIALVGALAISLALSWWELRRPLETIDRDSKLPKQIEEADIWGEIRRGSYGGLAAFVLAMLAHWAALAGAEWSGVGSPLLWLTVIALVPLAAVSATPKFLACAAVIGFLIGVALLFMWLTVAGAALGVGIAAVVLLVLALCNNAPFKQSLPGFPRSAYAADNLANPDLASRQRLAHPAPIQPCEALEAWRRRRDPAAGKPKLVLLATSGGAYRAAFWTALLLDKFAECDRRRALPGITDSIRLITGASGGMVAGAYFTAMACQGRAGESVADAIERDTVAFQTESPWGGKRKVPIRRDSLTSVLQRMLRRDLPRVLWPFPEVMDRGRLLDAQWRSLDVTFAEIARSERAGLAPSIVLSPMLVESGAPAFFANLDLGGLRSDGPRAATDPDLPTVPNQESVEVFVAFPAAYLHDESGAPVPEPTGDAAAAHREAMPRRGVTLATAVRLNATFPFISPAVSLPTAPPKRRLVDAGYYDNYGIDMITAYLNNPEIREWITANCSGVAILQIRAFPDARPRPSAGRLGRALHFLTSPVEALFSARQASQMFRNNQQLRLAMRAYPLGFARAFAFEAAVDASMSWYLGEDELAAMRDLIDAMDGGTPGEDARAAFVTLLEKGDPRWEAAFAEMKRRELEAEFRALREFWAEDHSQPDDAEAPAGAPAARPAGVRAAAGAAAAEIVPAAR